MIKTFLGISSECVNTSFTQQKSLDFIMYSIFGKVNLCEFF